ncbi:hypothetical protein FB451DRAFT_1568225 [Mycena latifolia]|nr:hypothetical protein FB451DRAFT_1568225 [Mycena latifolia]
MSICRKCEHQNSEQLRFPRPDTSHRPNLSPQEQRAALTRIKSQILRYQTEIEALEGQEQALEDSLSLIVYPVLTLPIEITSRILVHCLPTHGRVSPSPSTAPLILVQICRHWREVALSTCELWSSIYVELPFNLYWFDKAPIGPRDHGARALVQTWLSRAKGHPISLGLNHQLRIVPDALVSLILSFAGQIRHLDLHLVPEQFSRLRPLHTSFPILQHLATSHSSYEELQELLKDAPSLRELRLLGRQFSVNFSLPLLTHLEITEEVSKETFLYILTNFPVLSHLAFSLNEFESRSITGTSIPTTFRHLSSLVVSSSPSSSALHLLTLPNLRKLDLPPFYEPEDLDPFLTRSSCSIDHLVMAFDGFDDDEAEEVVKALKVFPSVVVLELRSSDVNALMRDLHSPSLLPRLREIIVSSHIGPNAAEIDYEDIIEMLDRRRDSPRAVELRKFHLNMSLYAGNLPDDFEYVWCPGSLASSELERFIADGLDFIVTFEPNGQYYRWPEDSIVPDLLPHFP